MKHTAPNANQPNSLTLADCDKIFGTLNDARERARLSEIKISYECYDMLDHFISNLEDAYGRYHTSKEAKESAWVMSERRKDIRFWASKAQAWMATQSIFGGKEVA